MKELLLSLNKKVFFFCLVFWLPLSTIVKCIIFLLKNSNHVRWYSIAAQCTSNSIESECTICCFLLREMCIQKEMDWNLEGKNNTKNWTIKLMKRRVDERPLFSSFNIINGAITPKYSQKLKSRPGNFLWELFAVHQRSGLM